MEVRSGADPGVGIGQRLTNPPTGSQGSSRGGGIVAHRDSGGSTDTSSGIGGVTPSAQSNNPMYQGLIQRYASYPTEKLTELSAMMGGTQQGQIIQQILNQRRSMPQQSQSTGTSGASGQQSGQSGQSQQSSQAQPSQNSPLQQVGGLTLPNFNRTQQQQGTATGTTFRKGGGVPNRQSGGMSLSQESPWWTRSEARSQPQGSSGLLNGLTSGRSDQVQTQAPAGSHVIPADVVAGLGEGNTLSGARVMQEIISSGPHGIPMPRGSSGHGTFPRAPAVPQNAKGGQLPVFEAKPRAKGGTTGQHDTPVDLSDGEFLVHPNDVIRWGNGDQKLGHRIFDKFIVHQRAKHIKTLKKLPPPVGMPKKDRA